MFKKFLKKIGWISEEERSGKMVDAFNCYSLFEIKDPRNLLIEILNLVPDDSIWAIEGVYSEHIISFLKQFHVEDDESVELGTVWPSQKKIRVLLTKDAKNAIIEELKNWNIDVDIVHQHIYKSGFFYFTSYDNLKSGCIWLTNQIEERKISPLIEKNFIGEYEKYPDNAD